MTYYMPDFEKNMYFTKVDDDEYNIFLRENDEKLAVARKVDGQFKVFFIKRGLIRQELVNGLAEVLEFFNRFNVNETEKSEEPVKIERVEDLEELKKILP